MYENESQPTYIVELICSSIYFRNSTTLIVHFIKGYWARLGRD